MLPLWLALLAIVVGACGTIIGAGGGFVLVPILILLYPGQPPEAITAVSLTCVFFNAASGTVAYARAGRVDFRSGLLFAAAGLPGAVLGAWGTELIPAEVFNGVFGGLLCVMGLFLILSRHREPPAPPAGSGRLVPPHSRPLGAGISFGVGFLSSLFGIGGGIIHVPMMSRVLKFPTHVATATSHFILAIMTGAGAAVHLFRGELSGRAGEVLPLAAGMVIGAQLGAAVSRRVHGQWIVRGLALALLFVGTRILVMLWRS